MVQVMNIMFRRTESVPADIIAAFMGGVILDKDPVIRGLSDTFIRSNLISRETFLKLEKIQYTLI